MIDIEQEEADFEWLMNQLSPMIEKFLERVAIKIDSGIDAERARNETFIKYFIIDN